MSTAETREAAQAHDPILLAILRHAKADLAYDAAIADGKADDDNSAMEAEHRTRWALVETAPTTLTGCRELCAHLARYAQRDRQWSETRDYDRERDWQFGPRLLGNIRDALAKLRT